MRSAYREAKAIKSCFQHGISRLNALRLITVMLPESYLEGLHELVRQGMYPSRSTAIRTAVRDLLRRELWNKQ